jgi:hypothetical protein
LTGDCIVDADLDVSRLARQTKKIVPQTRAGRSGGSKDLIPSTHRAVIGLPSSKISMGFGKGKSKLVIINERSLSSEHCVSLIPRTYHYSTPEENLETVQRQRLNGRCVHRAMDTSCSMMVPTIFLSYLNEALFFILFFARS